MTYILALSIIAMLSLLSHYFVQSIVAEQEATARVVNLAGRQRMLSQRITRMAGEAARTPSSPLDQDYTTLIETLLSAHYALMHGSAGLHIPEPKSAAIKNIFMAEPYNLDRTINIFAELARQLGPSGFSGKKSDRLYEELKSISDGLLGTLDTLVLQYQKDSESAIATLQQYNRVSLTGMCVTLLLEAVLIFRPLLLALYRREKQYQELLGKKFWSGSGSRPLMIP